jgi:hypothetical protein
MLSLAKGRASYNSPEKKKKEEEKKERRFGLLFEFFFSFSSRE